MNQTALEKGRARVAELRRTGQLERLDPLEKAARNPKSMRLAINAMCWDCVGGNADPSPRQRIRDCEIPKCPLWPLRPHQSVKGRSDACLDT